MERQPSLESKTMGKKRRAGPSACRSPSPASVTAPVSTVSGRPPRSGELVIVPTPSAAAASPPEHTGNESEADKYDMNDDMSESQPMHVSIESGSKEEDGSVDGGGGSFKPKRQKKKNGIPVSQNSKKPGRGKSSPCWKHFTMEASKSELLRYLDEPNVDPDDTTFVLLDWWKVNTHRFPVISRMAKRFLTIPATSVSSESTFSTGGRVLDDYRSSLLPPMVEKLVCASSWIRGSYKDLPRVVVKDEDDDVELVPFPDCVVESS